MDEVRREPSRLLNPTEPFPSPHEFVGMEGRVVGWKTQYGCPVLLFSYSQRRFLSLLRASADPAQMNS